MIKLIDLLYQPYIIMLFRKSRLQNWVNMQCNANTSLRNSGLYAEKTAKIAAYIALIIHIQGDLDLKL